MNELTIHVDHHPVIILSIHSLTHSLTYLLTHLLTHSLTYSLTHSLSHLLTHSLTHSLTYSLSHAFKGAKSGAAAMEGAHIIVRINNWFVVRERKRQEQQESALTTCVLPRVYCLVCTSRTLAGL